MKYINFQVFLEISDGLFILIFNFSNIIHFIFTLYLTFLVK